MMTLPVPDLGQVWALLVALLIFALCTALGAAVRGGSGARGVDFLVGYGATAASIIALGILPIRTSLSAVAAAVLVVAASYALLARQDLRGLFPLGRVVALALPLLLVATALPPVHWDDYSHWVPNAAYLYRHDSFPNAGLPASTSQWPGYPYGMAIWTWLVSLGSGAFVANAGTVFSALLLVAAAALVLEAVQQAPSQTDPPTNAGWSMAALSFLVVTALSPSFHRSHSLTGYADTGTSVAVAALAWLGCHTLQNKTGRTHHFCKAEVQFLLVALLLVSLKQVNLVLLALVCLGLSVAALLEGWPSGLIGAARIGAAAAPAALLWVLWQRYASSHVPMGDFHWLPIRDWRWGYAPTILRAMADQALRLPAHFLLMMVMTGAGIRALHRGATGRAETLAIVAGVTFLGYTAFLFITYVGAGFAESEVRRAASFHRYSTHAGTLGILAFAAAFGGGLAERSFRYGRLTTVASVLLLGAVMLSVPLGWRHFISARKEPAIRAQALAATIGKDEPRRGSVAVIAPTDDGFLATLVQYALSVPVAPAPELRVTARIDMGHPDPIAAARAVAEDRSIGQVVLQDAPPEISKIFGLEGPVTGLVWLSRSGETWLVRQRQLPVD
jgi:hypothetical protein